MMTHEIVLRTMMLIRKEKSKRTPDKNHIFRLREQLRFAPQPAIDALTPAEQRQYMELR